MRDDPRAYAPHPPRRRFVTAAVLAALFAFLAAAGLVVVQRVRTRREASTRAERARAPRAVLAVRIESAPRRLELRLPGEIHGFHETPVYAKIAGYLRTIAVDKGDRVSTGDVLAELDSPELDQQVRNARANFALRRTTNERFQALRRDGVVSQQDADQARADFLQAEAMLHELEAMQAYERITAEFAGMITARYVDPGTLIPQSTAGSLAANTAIVAMATLDRLRIYVDVPQADALGVQDGDEVVVTVEEYPGRRFPAAVTRHPQALAPATRTMLVEVDLRNEDAALLPGMYAQVTIDVARPGNAPRIPDDVLIFREGRQYVPVVADGHIRLTPVTLGHDDGRTSEVASGLRGGELVARNVGQTAQDGEAVEVHMPEPDHAADGGGGGR